jgi:AcrR family transcriptional regulator
VRDIIAKARVNQAAIYHFKSKDGLYFLKIAFKTLTENAGLDAEELKSLSREQALRRFVRHQLRPLLFQDEMSRYVHVRLGKRASVKGLSEVHSDQYKLIPFGRARYCTAIPAAEHTDRVALCAAICLMGQCSVFVRNRDLFAQDPFRMIIDEPLVDELSDLITRVTIGGLSHVEERQTEDGSERSGEESGSVRLIAR